MWSNDRALITSCVVGTLGATLAGIPVSQRWLWILYGGSYGYYDEYHPVAYFQLPIAIVIGFLTCFFLSLWFLKLTRGKHWGFGIAYGIGLGAMAGAIITFMVALCGYIVEILLDGFAARFVGDYIAMPFMVAFFGALVGMSVGLLLSLVFGPWLLEMINKPAAKQD
jgi:hypothetical protein